MDSKLPFAILTTLLAGPIYASDDQSREAEAWLNNFKMADLDYSGGLSKAELDKAASPQFASIARHFEKMDVNRDAQVTPKEYADLMQKRRDVWLAAFKAADVNLSGGLSKAELEKTKPTQFVALKKHFDLMDGNKDGQITPLERDSFKPPTTPASAAPIDWQNDFRRLDLNDSGGLSKTELAQTPPQQFADLKQSFDQIDTSKDGQVTSAEYTAYLSAPADDEPETGIIPFLRNLF